MRALGDQTPPTWSSRTVIDTTADADIEAVERVQVNMAEVRGFTDDLILRLKAKFPEFAEVSCSGSPPPNHVTPRHSVGRSYLDLESRPLDYYRDEYLVYPTDLFVPVSGEDMNAGKEGGREGGYTLLGRKFLQQK